MRFARLLFMIYYAIRIGGDVQDTLSRFSIYNPNPFIFTNWYSNFAKHSGNILTFHVLQSDISDLPRLFTDIEIS